MRIEPLRNQVVVRVEENGHPRGRIQVVTANRPAVRQAVVVRVGPECRDVGVGERVVVNLLTMTQVGEEWLVAEHQVLGSVSK
jgi:co-chaperonin GroES (HSP10)